MSTITVTILRDDAEYRFEDSNLSASYSVERAPDGDVVVRADLYEGSRLIDSVLVERFLAQDVDSWVHG